MKKSPAPRGAKKRTVLIVDDHPFLREGVTKVINQTEDLEVCGEAGSAKEALLAFERQRPDALIVDISLEDGSGLDLIKNLCAQHRNLAILAFSMYPETLYAERALHAGARGYVTKSEPAEVLLAALRKILRGQVAVSERMVSRLLGASRGRTETPVESPADLLSDRELEVFRLFGTGRSTRQIAAGLHLSASTVESYRSAIKQKLGLANATELVASAARFVATKAGG